MKKIIRYIPWILSFVITVRITAFIIGNGEAFTRKFDAIYFGDLYSKSQYVVGQRSIGGIGDDGLYAFAGYYYLFGGGDIASVNFEHPPLGKYLIGLSILHFGNQNIINIIYFVLLLVVSFQLAKSVGLGKIGSWISILVVGLDPLFLDNLLRSLLDLPFTVFFVSAVYFFLKGLKDTKYFLISNILWGAAFSTRFFPAFVFVYLLELAYIVCLKKGVKQFLFTSLSIPVVYLATHVMYFVHHPSFVEFLRHKRWMLSWFSGSISIAGNIWRSLMTGWYINPSGLLRRSDHWWILVPFIVASAVFTPLVKNINRKSVLYLYLLSLIYLLYLTFLTNGDQKFVMPLYPILAVLSLRTLTSLYSIIRMHADRIRSRPD